MNKFEFMTSDRILFERNGLKNIGKLAQPFGKKALVEPEAEQRMRLVLKNT